MRSLKLGTAGMRGVVGSGLTTERAIDFAAAFGTLLDGGRVLIGRDTRYSSGMLHHAVIAALLGCGCEVIDAGIAPAGLIHFLTPELKADGAIMLGGGHQGMGWNSIIPLAAAGNYFNHIQFQELFDIYHSHRYRQALWNAIPKVVPIPADSVEHYLDALCGVFDVKSIAAAKLTVIADLCNGSGAVVADKLALRLGIKLIAINNIFSGVLPHEPEPRPRSAAQVRSIMAPLQADIGLVFNSDVSRLAIVTDSGETLSEELTLPLAADYILADCPHCRVVTNICSSRTLDDIVARHQGELYKTKVGQADVIDRMIELGATLAGEGSGGFASKNWVKGFDGFYAMTVLLEYLARSGRKLSELAEKLPRYHIVKDTVNCQSSHAYGLIRHLRKISKGARIIEEDGLRLDWPDGWVSLRTSATEPVLRLISEATSSELAADRAFQIRGLIERVGGGA